MIDPYGLADYMVHWSILSTSFAGMSAGKIKGTVVSMTKNKDGFYDAVNFEGWVGGVSVGVPVGATFNNKEVFSDACEKADVKNIQGPSRLLSGTAAFHNEGVSGGGYHFGALSGTEKDVSEVEGYDLAVDYLGGYIRTTTDVYSVSNPNLK